MGGTGGICFLCLYKTNLKMNRQPLWKRCLTGSAIVTGIEFVVGCIVNVKLKWNVWDYSKMHFNLGGQVCLLYSVLWFFLCMPLSFLSRVLHNKMFRWIEKFHLVFILLSSFYHICNVIYKTENKLRRKEKSITFCCKIFHRIQGSRSASVSLTFPIH